MARLDGKVAIVTGASMGIGRACAERMAEAGARVALADIDSAAGEEAARQIRARGGNARFFACDVAREASVQSLMQAVVAAFGSIDVLVNNAGIVGIDKPTHEIMEAEWDEVQAVNVKGPFFCTKHAVPHLRRSTGAAIVNLSSIYGLVGAADVPPYHASKGALRLMSKTDALIYARDGIRVNSIHPGYVWTSMVQGHLARAGGDVEARKRELNALHPLGRMGTPDDIAWGVVYLASDEARFVTGAELVIDGGYTAR